MKTGFVFPGQGSQHVGMGVAARAQWPQIDAVLARIERLTGHDLVTYMTNGPEEALTETVRAQLAVFGLSTALQQLLLEHGIHPSVVTGHSLGEYSALVCGGWLDLEPAALAVARRAEAMAECCQARPGTMTALLGADRGLLRAVLDEFGGSVAVANDNAPGQVVVSGPIDDVRTVERVVAEARIGSAVRLPVAGAFHSPLMQPAQDRIAEIIERLPLQPGHTPLLSSVTGDLVTDIEAYRAQLAGQMTAPVRWVDVTSRLLATADELIEVGTGTVLRGLIRKLDRRRAVRSCRDAADLHELGLPEPTPAHSARGSRVA
jgi:[acyl-carrier-protein] S-malonyltransferase